MYHCFFRGHVCLSNLQHAPSRELPLTACKTVFSHLKGNCYSTLLKQYHERAHCLRLAMPLVCVCVFFTSYRVKTKKFFATGSLPRFVYGSFQTDPSKVYFENRYPSRTPLKSQAQFAKKKTRKIVMNIIAGADYLIGS